MLIKASRMSRYELYIQRRQCSKNMRFGIFNWAVDGLMRLLKRGYFLESAAGLEAKATAEELGSPVIAFVREWCTLGSGKQTRSQDLYNAYKRWCEEAGRSRMGRNRFYEEFMRAYSDCTRIKLWTEIGQPRVWAFDNIDLDTEYHQTAH